MSIKTFKKDQSIETLRGLAIILMVAGHVIGNTSETGMRVEDDSVFRHMYFSLKFLRMPLFTVISGYVYALRPLDTTMIGKFIKGKARRILLPMIAVGTLQYFVRIIVPGTNKTPDISNIWSIYFFPFDQFWFLQSIFLIFLSITLLEYFKLLRTPLKWFISFIFVCGMFLQMPLFTSFFSFFGYIYLFPFFILGIGLYRFSNFLLSNKISFTLLFVFVASIIVQQLAWYNYLTIDLDRYSPLSLTIGISGIILLFKIKRNLRWLAWFGYYAYGIYLFHVFGTAGSRIIISKFGIHHGMLIFSVGLLAGLLFPILLETFIDRSPRLRLIFLGLKPRQVATGSIGQTKT
ncbi:MAG TPA: acyltransferase [Bacteroidales bacterium]|nr:acyltransferase [Bacteroidales bacterium]